MYSCENALIEAVQEQYKIHKTKRNTLLYILLFSFCNWLFKILLLLFSLFLDFVLFYFYFGNEMRKHHKKYFR